MASKPSTGSDSGGSSNAEKGDVKFDLHPVQSVGEGDMIEMVDTTNGQFHRSFTPHQVHVGTQLTPLFQHVCPLTGAPPDHFPWVQHWLGAVHRYRRGSGRWWPWKHGYCLPSGLHMRLGCPSISL